MKFTRADVIVILTIKCTQQCSFVHFVENYEQTGEWLQEAAAYWMCGEVII